MTIATRTTLRLAATIVGRVKGLARIVSRLDLERTITEWIKQTHAAALEILGVAGHEDETVNPRSRSERHVPPVLVLGAEHSRPFLDDRGVDGNDAVDKGLFGGCDLP
ncbi:hypothetical protein ABMA32_22515 [Mesorhizobium sp. VNQ89]|uniref:hypothetical protein n=1 Tax=Mesorhizobium quangtriensis TaxID=3157709 RepID=UPI0032B6FBA1